MSEFWAACSAGMLTDLPLWAAVALAGLVGSVSHCSVMCGPMLASQLLLGGRQRGLVAAYHAGRAVTYVALGLLAYFASRFVLGSAAGWQPGMLLLAGGVFVLSALKPKQTHHCGSAHGRGLNKLIGTIHAPHLQRFARGLFMGLMPCGMLLSVLLLAGASAHPAVAAGLMLVFALSTIPVLQLAGLALRRACGSNESRQANIGRGLMGLNGIYIGYLGASALMAS